MENPEDTMSAMSDGFDNTMIYDPNPNGFNWEQMSDRQVSDLIENPGQPTPTPTPPSLNLDPIPEPKPAPEPEHISVDTTTTSPMPIHCSMVRLVTMPWLSV